MGGVGGGRGMGSNDVNDVSVTVCHVASGNANEDGSNKV